MKKVLLLGLLLPIWLLMWCWEVKPTPEPTQVWEKVIEQKQDEVKELYIWETAVFKDYDFTVLSYEETDTLKSNNMFEWDFQADEYTKYLVVTVQLLNTTNDSFWQYKDHTITDWKWRHYDEANIISSFYTDKDINDTTFRPWIPTTVDIIFIVAWDSTDYYFDYQNSQTKQKYKIYLKEKPTE